MMTGGFSGYEFRMTGTKFMAPGTYPADGTPFKVPYWDNKLELQKTPATNVGKWMTIDNDPSNDLYVKTIGSKIPSTGGYKIVTSDSDSRISGKYLTNNPQNPYVVTWGSTQSNPWNVV
jgi:hypothetical protein